MGAAGTTVTYSELEARSNRVAWLAREHGLRPGDGLAAIVENRPEMFDLAWGAQRSGLQFTAVNWHLTADEARYVVTDSRAGMVVVSSRLSGLAARLGEVLAPGGPRRRTLPGAGETGHDRLVGAGPVRVLLDDRRFRRGFYFLRRVAAQARIRRAAADGCAAHPGGRRRRPAAGR